MNLNSSRIWKICRPLILGVVLTGCSEQNGQINSLKDNIARANDNNATLNAEVQKLTQELSLLNQKVRADGAKRTEFEAKSKKSGENEQLVVKFRTELEAAYNKYSEDLAAYRQKYTSP